MRLTGLFAIVLGLSISAACLAIEDYALTDAELMGLPHYCTVRIRRAKTPEFAVWQQNLGPDFLHTHHYCYGLAFIQRYYRSRVGPDKRFYLQNAMGTLEYMVTHAKPDYSLMPDVYLNLGLVYSLMGKPAKAVQDLLKALELNPRLPRAYNMLADFYAGTKQTDKALATISKGLQYNPDTKSLQRRYLEFGGKLPYPEALKDTPDKVAEPTAPDAAPQQNAAASPAAPTAAEPVAPTDPVSEPKIGSPTNPYCRFCVD